MQVTPRRLKADKATPKRYERVCSRPCSAGEFWCVLWACFGMAVNDHHAFDFCTEASILRAQDLRLTLTVITGFLPLSKTEVTRDFRDLTGLGVPQDVRRICLLLLLCHSFESTATFGTPQE
jgi:hypothetical protein